MVTNNFLQDVAVSPLVFPSEGAPSGPVKPVLPPVEEILDVSDDEDMDIAFPHKGNAINGDHLVKESVIDPNGVAGVGIESV